MIAEADLQAVITEIEREQEESKRNSAQATVVESTS